LFFSLRIMSGIMMHTCDPNTWEAAARKSWVWGQPGLYNKTLPQKKIVCTFFESRAESPELSPDHLPGSPLMLSKDEKTQIRTREVWVLLGPAGWPWPVPWPFCFLVSV
jgi:hypothetical protein